MSSFWTLERVCRALGLPPMDGRPIRAISTDTRSLQPGDCFVALRGERFDAHDHLDAAVDAGAAALVLADARRAPRAGVPVLEVPDTLVALGQLARYRRDAWGKLVVAIGGSNGKTSTKELLRAALGGVYDVHATAGNFNNQVGVPLTLLALPDSAEIAVVEAGSNAPGEIALLREIIRPDVALVTTVQEEHLEGFGDLAGVLAEELSLCADVPLAVVPADEAAVVDAARVLARRVVTAGLERGDRRATAQGLDADGRGWCQWDGVRIHVPLHGAHNLRNAALALAVAAECGVSAEQAARGLQALQPPPMRSAVQPLGRALLVHDAYNSNPGSARAALELLRAVGEGRQRVAVLGTMGELGAQADRAHREVAEAALASGADLICGIGQFVAALGAVAPADARVVTAPDVDELWAALRPRLAPDAAILLKASRSVKLERLVPHLTTWASA